jgi:hypothetical protein
MHIKIKEVTGKTEMDRFIRFPGKLYQGDRNFVFEPISLQKEFMSTHKNPFFKHSGAKFFLAYENESVLGRVATIVNNIHNEKYQEKTGFFGFFECVENYDVARILLDKVKDEHIRNGYNWIIGPTNFTTNDSCGFLSTGFDKPPMVLMPYNKSYYNDFMLEYGFSKETDLASYYFGTDIIESPFFLPMVRRISEKLEQSAITIRKINYSNLDEDVIQMREVYNQTNTTNWGFVPLTPEEFSHMAHQFRQFVPESFVQIAEKDNKQIGFMVTLPDLNQVFRHIRSGKLFPFGFLKYLWYKRRINGCRILILGVLQEYRNKGLDILFYWNLRNDLLRKGITEGEACYVMETNGTMKSIVKKIGCRKTKEYRIYKLDIA